MSTPGTYGGLKYESPTTRALSTISDEDYEKVYNDQAALTSKLVNDVSFIAANLRKVQSQADQADENVIQQLQDFINDIQVIMGGQGDTGFDFGDFKYVLQAYGALFDFIGPDGQVQVPTNLDQAVTNFFNQYLFGGQNWQQAFDASTDQEIATMLDIMGEVPILNQAAEQLAVIISKNRDNIDTIANVFNTFFQAFNIPPGGTFDLATFMNATNSLYTGLESLFSDVNYGSFQPIFEQMARWDQQVIDAITQLSEGNLQGLIGLIPISQLTNSQPNLQAESDFADSDSIAANNAGWSWDGSVGNQALGSAKLVCDGLQHGMNGEPIAIDEGQTLNPSVNILWSGVTSTGSCVQLVIRANNGVDYVVAQTSLTNPDGGWLELSGSWTNPTGSGITSAKSRFVVTSAVTAGHIWFDDAPDTVSGTLIPQDWINNLTAQWNTFLASMGFDSNLDYIGSDPSTIWTTWLANINSEFNLLLTPTSPLDANFFTGDIWANLLGLIGLTPSDLTGSIDTSSIWTDIANDFLLPTNTVTSQSDTTDLVNTTTAALTGASVTPPTWLTDLYNSLLAIPGVNVAGMQGITNIIDSIQTLGDQIVSGLQQTSSSNNPLSQISQSLQQTVLNIETALGVATDNANTLGIVNNSPVSSGYLDTVISNFDWHQTLVANNQINLTSGAAKAAVLRIRQAKTLGFVQWFGNVPSAGGVFPTFLLSFYKMDSSGNFNLLFTSADFTSNITQTSLAEWAHL